MLLIFIIFFIPTSIAHVLLTFPPARKPSLDFLDSVRTPLPCGVPRPTEPVYTTLIAGQALNVSWSLGYPHKGGYRLSLLDGQGSLIRYLGDPNLFMGADAPLTEHRVLVLPQDLKCEACILRLERQALEWGSSYGFHSCADVSVVAADDARVARPDALCQGPSTFSDGMCRCDGAYEGERCQFRDDCSQDSDCGSSGMCRLMGGSRYPKRVCYCSGGAFGRFCEKQLRTPASDQCLNLAFPEDTKKAEGRLRHGVFDPACYDQRTTEGGHSVFWRIVGNGSEVEFVLEFGTRSWVGLGWRPSVTSNDCKAFPLLTEKSPPPRPQGNSGFGSYHPPGPIHPMDCMDMVIGSAVGLYYRLGDHYTRDRSTPLADEEYGGSESLTGAFGVQLNASTVLMFRRPLRADERTDHHLGPDGVYMIWATGQDPQNIQHSPEAGLPSGSASQFYAEDVLKYHGARNRGILGVVNIVSSASSVRRASLAVMLSVIVAQYFRQ